MSQIMGKRSNNNYPNFFFKSFNPKSCLFVLITRAHPLSLFILNFTVPLGNLAAAMALGNGELDCLEASPLTRILIQL